MSLADVTANLRAPIATRVADAPTVRVHSVEWRKVQAGEPVEINPSVRPARPGRVGAAGRARRVSWSSNPGHGRAGGSARAPPLRSSSRPPTAALAQASAQGRVTGPSVLWCATQCEQVGHGYRVMSVDEWAARWKRNDAWPECLQCGGKNTKEHHFTQVGGGGGGAGRRAVLPWLPAGPAARSQRLWGEGALGRSLAHYACRAHPAAPLPTCPPAPSLRPLKHTPTADLVPRQEEVGERVPVPGLPLLLPPRLRRPRLQDARGVREGALAGAVGAQAELYCIGASLLAEECGVGVWSQGECEEERWQARMRPAPSALQGAAIKSWRLGFATDPAAAHPPPPISPHPARRRW